MSEIPYGYCHCGCGRKTTIPTENQFTIGRIKGEPMRFIHGHNGRGKLKIVTHNGYRLIRDPDHPRSNMRGYVSQHILIATEALGKPLPVKAKVHHHNQNQLVICQDQSYHLLLHKRQRAYEACGHANWLKCGYCHEYDDPKNLYVYLSKTGRTHATHRLCSTNYQRSRKNGR